jgi:hypothetical protein
VREERTKARGYRVALESGSSWAKRYKREVDESLTGRSTAREERWAQGQRILAVGAGSSLVGSRGLPRRGGGRCGSG